MIVVDRIKQQEDALGITQDNFEKKFVFHRLKDRFLSSMTLALEQLFPDGHDNIYLPNDRLTPSQRQGISERDEILIRMHGGSMISQAGITLRLPVQTIITAQNIFQRFFAKYVAVFVIPHHRNSFLEHDYREVCMGSLFLASKVDETFRKIWDVAHTFISIFRLFDPNPVPFQTRELTHKIREVIVDQERIILKEMGFELFRFYDQPHKFIASFFNLFKSTKQVVKKIWGHLNDAYLTDLCVHYPPQVIAAGCIYLGMRQCGQQMPQQPWWVLLESSFSHIQEVAATLLQLNALAEKIDFKRVQSILPNFRESFIDNSFLIKQYARQSNMKEVVQDERLQPTPKDQIQGHKSNTSAKKKKEINKDRHKVDTKNDNKYKDKEKEREKEREKDKKKHKKHKYNSDNEKKSKSQSKKNKKKNDRSRSRDKSNKKSSHKKVVELDRRESKKEEQSIPQQHQQMDVMDVEVLVDKINPSMLEEPIIVPPIQKQLDTKGEIERMKNLINAAKLKKQQETMAAQQCLQQQRLEQAHREKDEESKLLELKKRVIARKVNPAANGDGEDYI